MPTNHPRRHRARLFLQRIRHYYDRGVAEILELVAAGKTTYPKSNVPLANVPDSKVPKTNDRFNQVQEEVKSISRHLSQECYTSSDEPTLRGPLRVLNPDPPSPGETTSSGAWADSRLSWQEEAIVTSPKSPYSTAVNTMTHLRPATSTRSSNPASSYLAHELEAPVPSTSGVRLRTNEENNAQPSMKSNARSTGYRGAELEWKRWSLYTRLAEIV